MTDEEVEELAAPFDKAIRIRIWQLGEAPDLSETLEVVQVAEIMRMADDDELMERTLQHFRRLRGDA